MPASICENRYGPPDELWNALRAANFVINKPSEWWSDPHLVDFVTAMKEIVSWANDMRPFSNKHKTAWISVLADYEFARKSTGALTQGNISGIESLDLAVRAVRMALPAAGNKVPIESSTLDAVKRAVAYVESELLQPTSLKEAFDELVRVSGRRSASVVRLRIARDFFWRLVELDFRIFGVSLSGR